MASPLPHGFNPFPWISLLPAVLSIVFLLSSQNTLRRTTAGRYFLTLLIFLSIWSMSYFFGLRAPSPTSAAFWIRVSTGYLLALPSLGYLLNVSILKAAGPSVRRRNLLLGVAVAFVLVHLTTDAFVAGTYRYSWGYFPRYGRPFFVFLGFCVLVQSLVLRDVFAHVRTAAPGALRPRNRLLLSAWVVACAGFPDFLAGYGIRTIPVSGLPLSYFVVVAFLLLERYGLTEFFPYLGLGSILQFSKDPIFLIRIDGTLQYTNLETARKLGYKDTAPVQGKPVNDLFSPHTPLFTQARVDALQRRMDLPTLELSLETIAGATIPIRVGLAGVFNRRNEILGLVAIGRDIREEIRREEELLRVNRSYREKIQEVEERTGDLTRVNQALEANRTAMLNIMEDMEESHGRLEDAYRRLSELDRTKDVFLSSVSHELRTPLTSIRSFSEILLQYPTEKEETQREFLLIIHQETERLTRLVNDLLDLAKIESGKNAWKRERVNVREVLSRSVQTFSPLAGEKRLTVQCDPEDDLPDLFLDRDRLYQVLYNLLSNAIKFTPPGGTIRLRAERSNPEARDGTVGPCVLVQVEDTGVGIQAKDLPLIFEKFHQGGEPTQGKPQGTGLGLAICREIVQYYGGKIWAESEPGRGCRLSFTLPARGAEEAA